MRRARFASALRVDRSASRSHSLRWFGRAPAAALARTASFVAREPEIKVLGIETSCDETGISVVSNTRVLSNAVASQLGTAHSTRFGGVVPHLAARDHAVALPRVLQEALNRSQCRPSDIAAIAVTRGPGLAFCLKEGLQFAKALSREWGKPLIGVNHLEAHAVVAALSRPELRFPFLTLLVSGGHTQLWIADALGRYRILGETADDALGEAFDKVARMLDLPRAPAPAAASQPSLQSLGAALEQAAARGDAHVGHGDGKAPAAFAFTEPMARHAGMDFSFSGLKTQVRQTVVRENAKRGAGPAPAAAVAAAAASDSAAPAVTLPPGMPLLVPMSRPAEGAQLAPETKDAIAAAFQRAALKHVARRTGRALEWAREHAPAAAQLVLCGGVAANGALRRALAAVCAEHDGGRFSLLCPLEHCQDNGVMIAFTGLVKLRAGTPADSLDIGYHDRWPVGPKVAQQS